MAEELENENEAMDENDPVIPEVDSPNELEQLETLDLLREPGYEPLSEEKIARLRLLRTRIVYKGQAVAGVIPEAVQVGVQLSSEQLMEQVGKFLTDPEIEKIKAKLVAGLTRDDIEREFELSSFRPVARHGFERQARDDEQQRVWDEHDRETFKNVLRMLWKGLGYDKLDPKLDEAVEAYQEGASISDASAMALLSPPTFTQRLKERGVKIRPPGRKPDNKRRMYAVLLHRAGYPVNKIVYAVSTAYLTVRGWLQLGGCDLSQRRSEVAKHLISPPPMFDTLPADWKPDNLIDKQWAGSPATLGLNDAWK